MLSNWSEGVCCLERGSGRSTHLSAHDADGCALDDLAGGVGVEAGRVERLRRAAARRLAVDLQKKVEQRLPFRSLYAKLERRCRRWRDRRWCFLAPARIFLLACQIAVGLNR